MKMRRAYELLTKKNIQKRISSLFPVSYTHLIMMIQRYAAGKRQEIDLKNTLHQLNEVLKTHFNLTVSLGVNVGGDSRIKIPEYYEKANRAAQLRFFDGKESFHETEAACLLYTSRCV